MTIKEKNFQARASVIAVRGALVALAFTPAAYAADDAVRDLTQGNNAVEIGVGHVDKSSAKFGEFNGLNKEGTYLNGGFSLRGGGPYDSDSTTRWRVEATDLGLDIRSLRGEFGEQGRFRINFGHDEIQRNQYNPLQTPYLGAGTRTLTLPGALNAATHPANLAIPAGSNLATTTNIGVANLLASPTNIQSPNRDPGTLAAPNTTASTSAAAANAGLGWLIPANMNSVEIGTQRKRNEVGVDLWISPQWSFRATASNATKDGLKLTGVPSVSTGAGVTVPELLQYTTNLYSAAFNYAGERANFNVGYYGSVFKNGTDTWTADSIWGINTVQGNVNRMYGAADNQMHQLKLSGSYAFTRATKLTLAGSTARSTQNESFIASGPFWYVPQSSANAKVDNTNFLARLTSRATDNLTLLASYRYENRDNKTPYMQTIATGRDALGSVTAASVNPCGPGAEPATLAVRVTGLTCYDNLPINIKQEQVVLQGDYRLARGHAFMAGYEWAEIKRNSDNAEQDPYRAHHTREQTLRFQYRNSVSQNLNGRIGYDYSQRRHSEFELEPVLGGVLSAAIEPILPNLVNYVVANRNRDRVRGMLGYQASESVSFNAGLGYNNDKYVEEDKYGKKSATSWQLNLDAAFAVSDTAALGVFYTYEDQKSQTSSLSILRASPTALNVLPANCGPYPTTASYSAAGAAVAFGSPSDFASDPCRIWRETQADKVHTFGLTFKSKPAPKWDLSGALTYTTALTPISFSGLQVVNNGLSIGATGGAAAVNNNIWIATQNLPEAKNTMWDLRLVGLYAIDKSSSLRLNFQHRKLTSSDAQWDLYASNPVAIQGYVGTGIGAPNYTVNVVSVNYIYSFK